MDNENETRPLLHSFESETWRSRARKRCMRVPSEITITGIILGLFLIVVTLLIVLENMETDKKEKNISLNDNLLASPMKYNKKVEDQTWQVKDYMKFKNKQMEEKSKKWDKVNKGWKQLPDISVSSMKINKDQLWQDNNDYMMLKQKKLEEKIKKWDKVNKGWKQIPDFLVSPMKFNKTVEDQVWQDNKDYMKFKQKKLEEKIKKMDKINKSWKQLPDLSASPMKFNKKAEDQLWQDNTDYIELKQKKMEEKIRKWDKVNKGWKKMPDILGDIHDHEDDLNDDVGTTGIGSNLDEYGKEIDDSLETFAKLRMSSPSEMRKFREQVLEVKNLLHSGINWKMMDDGWKALSEQGWKEKDIRRALFTALNEKRQEIKKAQLENILRSPMNIEDIWDQINESWKKNLYEGGEDIGYTKIKGSDEADRHLSINDKWRKEMNILQSPKSDMKKIVKEDEGWQKLAEQGWKNKDIEEKLIKAWKDRENVMQSPLNIEDLWVKATDFLRNLFNKGINTENSQMKTNDEWANKFTNILQSSFKKRKDNEEKKDKHSKDVWKDKNGGETDDEPQELQMSFDDFSNIIQAIKDHQKGMNNAKSQLEINDEFANTFGNILQSSYKKSKKYEELKKKHSKHDMKDNDADEIENDEPQQSPMNFDEFLEIIEAIKDHEKGKKEAEKQKDINNEWKNEIDTLHSSKPTDKRWKQIDDHFKTVIEYERNSVVGRNDGDSISSPDDVSIQKSIPFVHANQDKMGTEWQKLPEQGLVEKDIKEAVHKAWKNGEKLRNSAIGQNNMKWKKVNDGWKTISNKSFIPSRCPMSKFQLPLGSSTPFPPIDCALIAEQVKREFGRCIDLSFLPKECKPDSKETCFTTYKYRKMDGTCNNKIHPTWGKSGTPFIRMIEPDYADGVSALRASKDGGPLPNARLLSSKLYSKRSKPHGDTSVLFMYFGLLVDHDVTETALNSGDLPCCDEDVMNRPNECLQIDIPKEDPFYGPKNVPCLNLVRSAPVNGECGGRREQNNKATAFLDGSVVYGSTESQAKQLRTFSTGQLRTQLINGYPFMAYADGVGSICGTPGEPLQCFEAGDSRVNMMVELTAMHTLWYREHNRIAQELHKLNPQLTDELIYQEARIILIAELQHIAYNEFLPLLIGEKALEHYELKIDKSKIYLGYDETVNPSVFNVIAGAAFRVGHSLVPDIQYLLGPKNTSEGKVYLHETFFNVKILFHDGLDLLLRGAASQRTQTVDSYVSPEVREHLFQPSNLDYGYDLAAVGIQRGRDHGLPGYTRWRAVCGLSEVKTWDDLYNIMDKNKVNSFREVYESVEDIDLIPGALSENHANGSLVGPTYTCLIGRQFQKTRKGDRFWFENQNDVGSLTKDQLDEIYKSSMARIVCDNSDNIKEIQKNPFKVPSSQNLYVNCDTVPKVDLSKWSSVI